MESLPDSFFTVGKTPKGNQQTRLYMGYWKNLSDPERYFSHYKGYDSSCSVYWDNEIQEATACKCRYYVCNLKDLDRETPPKNIPTTEDDKCDHMVEAEKRHFEHINSSMVIEQDDGSRPSIADSATTCLDLAAEWVQSHDYADWSDVNEDVLP